MMPDSDTDIPTCVWVHLQYDASVTRTHLADPLHAIDSHDLVLEHGRQPPMFRVRCTGVHLRTKVCKLDGDTHTCCWNASGALGAMPTLSRPRFQSARKRIGDQIGARMRQRSSARGNGAHPNRVHQISHAARSMFKFQMEKTLKATKTIK